MTEKGRFNRDVSPPKHNYKTTPMPYVGPEEQSELLNGQRCTCGHDRLCHSPFLGHGKKQEFITNCRCAGFCIVMGCDCEKFVFSNLLSSEEGKTRYARERATHAVFPPQTKVMEKSK